MNDKCTSCHPRLNLSVIGLGLVPVSESGRVDLVNHAGDAGGHSVWYRWTAPSSTPVTSDTIGSSVSSLTTFASNDDLSTSSRNHQSRVSLTPVAGTYQIALD